MAHEIAHQWFGDAATETGWKHLWLSEGFATYMTHCYLENKYGHDTLKKGMEKDRTTLLAFENKRLTAVVDTTVKGDYMQLLNPNSYEKGGWVLHMLRRKLGDTLFWKGMRTYFKKDDNLNANTADFEHIMEQSSGQNLQVFFKQWLYTAGHPEIKLNWKYDTMQKQAVLTFVQKQDGLFDFPLEYKIDGKLYKLNISQRETTVKIDLAAKPVDIVLDPDVNLLAGFEVVAQ